MSRQAFVYMLASQKNGTLYTGVTSDLAKRIYEHKTKAHTESFTAKYTVDKLVWYETGTDITAAIELEKKIKNRNRAWKLALIERHNPEWQDLSLDFLDSAPSESKGKSITCHAAQSRSIQNDNDMDSAIALRSTQNDGGNGDE